MTTTEAIHPIDPDVQPYTDAEEREMLDDLRGMVNRAREIPAADVWRVVEQYRATVKALRAESQWPQIFVGGIVSVVGPLSGPPMLGGCTCWLKCPTIPVYRDGMTHLDDCPAKASGYPVGVLAARASSTPHVVADPAVPPDEIHLRDSQSGKLLGKIVGVVPAPPTPHTETGR